MKLKQSFLMAVAFFVAGVLDKFRRALGAVWGGIKRDGVRVFLLFSAASVMLAVDEPLAMALKRPEMAPWLMFAGLALYGVGLSHVLRRLLFPYIDLRTLVTDARRGNTGAGLVFLGVSFVIGVLLFMMTSLAKADEVPARAREYIPVLKQEQVAQWPAMPHPAVLAAQVEQETCPSLKHRMCWNPRAELRTSRERGVGLGQITKTDRFDALAEIRAASGGKLDGWAWERESIYDPRFQLRALVLKDLQTWKALPGWANDSERLRATLAGYNGGIGGVLSDRKVCAATPGCDPTRWVGHVEHTSRKAKVVASGYGQSFFQINRSYVSNITGPRVVKYEGLL